MRLTGFIFIFLFLLLGCGVKGDLQPKRTSEPLAPSFLNLQQKGERVQLSWDIPLSNQDGSRLNDLAGFRVDLYTYSPDQYCPECKDQESVATVHLDHPEPAAIIKGKVYLRLPLPATDRGIRFRVFPFTRSGKVGPFVESRLIARSTPAAPLDIEATAVDRGVKLLWALPEDIQESGELLGINIYRGESGNLPGPDPINKHPIKGNNFDDFGLVNGQEYQYGLRTVVRVDNSLVESSMSEVVTATPQAGL